MSKGNPAGDKPVTDLTAPPAGPAVMEQAAMLYATIYRLESELTQANTALARVTGLHQPFRIFDECDHTIDEIEAEDGRHFEIAELGLTCEDGLRGVICRECCTVDDEQTEECATHHRHSKDPANRCTTMMAIERSVTEPGEL